MINWPFHRGELLAQSLAGGGSRGGAIRALMPEQHRTFFEALPFVAVASTQHGVPVATLWIGAPGFVTSPDPQTLQFAVAPDPADPATSAFTPGAPGRPPACPGHHRDPVGRRRGARVRRRRAVVARPRHARLAPAHRVPLRIASGMVASQLPVTSDTSVIEAFLRRAPYLHAYELGDLDPREAGHTTWIANTPVDAVVLVYRGLATPTIIALAHDDPAALHALLAAHAHELPPRFYAHLTPGVEAALAPRYRAELLGHHLKMALASPVAGPSHDAPDDAPDDALDDEIVRLAPRHAGEAVQFYAASYPASYFEPVNLERGPYVAIRDEHGIAAIAGVHVYSPALRVASLGNIATRPDARGRGYARRVTAALCRLLQAEIDVIGLNVRADNAPAIACYRAVGFDARHEYREWLITQA